MKKEMVFVFVLCGIFLLGYVDAGPSSSSQTEFTVGGCTIDFNGGSVSVAAGECSGDPAYGYFYCDSGMNPLATTDEGLGCSMGSTSYVPGDTACCPSGMFCNETVSGKFKCDARIDNCVDQDNPTDCKNAYCLWMDITGECVENTKDYSCGYYDTSALCLADKWKIGLTGVGSKFCDKTIACAGLFFSSSCGCEWYPLALAGDKCQLKLTAGQSIYGIGEDPDEFECSSVYSLGNCSDEGVMNVTWDSSSLVLNGFDETFGFIPEACLDAFGCNGGEATRFCGEPMVKLPGFSLFSLLACLFVIGLYYSRLGKFK